uniref:DNA damage regulated autophagy modulator 2 n=1 Tax=Stegastes partitus TaxID=144197 RepID=A0A3B5AZ30_9TELE
MWWFQQGLCFLPAALVVWTAASFVFAYITAVVLRHVDPLVPYIRSEPPHTHLNSAVCIATVYVRYKQVEALTGEDELKLRRLNRIGLLLGLISSFGMCVVANFQKTTLFSMHLVGAILTFGVGALYILVQTLLSFYMQPHVHSRTTYLVRLTIGACTLGSIISMFVSSVIMYSVLSGVDVPRKLHWTPGEPGYAPHIVSTVSEWCLAFSFISFFLTYIRDFQKINLRAVAVVHCSHLYDRPHGGVAASRQNKPSETSPLLAGST